MWNPEEHTDADNIQWAFLRASEWRLWPLFVFQPVVPILLWFYPFFQVILTIILITFGWWFYIASTFTPNTSIDTAVYYTKLKLLTSPVAAFAIWSNEHPFVAALALAWPFFGNIIVLWLLMVPMAVFENTKKGRAARIGAIHKRMMIKLGYVQGNSGYIRNEAVMADPLSQ